MSATPYILNDQMPKIAAKFNIREVSATDTHGLGMHIADNWGNHYRWVRMSTAASDHVQAKLVSPECNDADVEGWLEEFDNATLTGGSSSANSTGTHAAGDTWLRITLATVFDSVVENQFSGCMLAVVDGATGEGYQYPIKSNAAVASSMVIFELHEAVQELIVSGTNAMTIAPSLVNNLVIAEQGNDNIPVGVTLAAIDVSATPYAWIQTRGIVVCLMDGATGIAAGDAVCLSDDDAGAAHVAGGGGTSVADFLAEAYLGTAIHAPDDGTYGQFLLTNGMD